MHGGDPAAAARRPWISADRRKRDSTKSGATQAQARAQLLRVGAAVGFGAMPSNARLSGEGQPARACLALVPAPNARTSQRSNGAG
jgi:hypothetical protein